MLASRISGAAIARCRGLSAVWHASSESLCNVRRLPVVCHNVAMSRTIHTSVSCLNPVTQRAPNQKQDWNKAVSEAEKIVGYPTSFLSLRWLLSDEIANIALHLRKLIGSSHPLLKAVKSLMYSSKGNMQAWGLIVLLVSKAAGHINIDEMEQDKAAGVLYSQRALAEMTEMIRTAHLVHKGLVNLSPEDLAQIEAQDSKDLLFGNKIALLGGDYLLSNVVQEVAALKNQEITDLVASTIQDLAESEFFGRRDAQNIILPLPPAGRSAKDDWTQYHELASGSLLGKSCQGTLKLAGHTKALQEKGYEFGKHLALAWQASVDVDPFTPGAQYVEGTAFSLMSAPVIFHLEHDPKVYDLIEAGAVNVENVDYAELHRIVSAGPGVVLTKGLCQEHSQKAMEVLAHFEESDARTALSNIIVAMGEL